MLSRIKISVTLNRIKDSDFWTDADVEEMAKLNYDRQALFDNGFFVGKFFNKNQISKRLGVKDIELKFLDN